MKSVADPTMWFGFSALVLFLLALDLLVFHKDAKEEKVAGALGWTAFWIAISLSFNGLIYARYGAVPAMEYLTGYLIEKALSVDNLFVFLVVFSYFKVPKELQHRVLFWGIFGALVLRIIFILSGAALLQRFHWLMYVFGAALVYMGSKLLFQGDDDLDPGENRALKLARRYIPSVNEFHGPRFFVRVDGKRMATPLFFVLVVIEATDIVFAVDSIPAIFAVTRDPFIVYSSNIFAILGLRALYFALAAIMDKFHYLKIGVSIVLTFVGIKMLVMDFYKVPVAASLLVILALLCGSIVLSVLRPKPASS